MATLLSVLEADIQVNYAVGGVPTVNFTIPWPFFTLDDLDVYVDGVLKVRGPDYDITAIEADDIGFTGGTVLFVNPLSSVTVTLVRNTPITRESDFPRGSALSIDVLNSDLDKAIIISQELAWGMGRTIKLAETDTSFPSLYLPAKADRAGKILSFDSTGDILTLAAATGDEVVITDASKVPLGRLINAGTGLTGGGNLSTDRTISLDTTGVTPGSYTNANITVDVNGRVTLAASGAAGSGDVPSTRAVTVASPITGGGTLGADIAIGHAASGAVAGTYINPTVTVNSTGHVTSIAANAAGLGVATSRTITSGVGLTGGGDLSADRTIDLENTGVVAGTYTNANITVDAQGRVTEALNGSAASGVVPETRIINTTTPLSGGGALSGNLTLTHGLSGVTPGAYTNPTVTVNETGHVTSITSNAEGADVPTSRVVSAGTGLSGGGDLTTNRTFALANTAVSPGSYTLANITVDAQGRLTSASSGTAPSSVLWINVKDYGAVGNGSTDDTAAFNSAVAALPAAGVLYVPAGKYKLTSNVAITKQHVRVFGDGINISILVIAHTGEGLTINISSVQSEANGLAVEGLTFEKPNGFDGGTALKLVNTTGNASEMRVTLRDLMIRSHDIHGTTSGFAYGIDLQYMRFIDIINVSIWGYDNMAAVNGRIGIRWQTSNTVPMVQCVVHQLSIYGYYFGFWGGGWIEGLYFHGGEIWECAFPIYIDRSGVANDAGAFYVHGVHLNAGYNAFTAYNTSDINISGCSIHHGNGSASLVAQSGSLIYCENTRKIAITGNNIECFYPQSASVNGVVVMNGSVVTISGNTFTRIKSSNIWMAGTVEYFQIAGNMIEGLNLGGNYGIYVYPTASKGSIESNRISNVNDVAVILGANVNFNSQGHRGARLVAAGSMSSSVSSGAVGVIPGHFSSGTEDYDTDGFISGGVITIPANRGVQKVRITMNLTVTGGGSAGQVQALIYKNGTNAWAGAPRITSYIEPNGEVSMQVCTGVILVNAGDVFQPAVGNITLGSITLRSGASRSGSFFEVEVVA